MRFRGKCMWLGRFFMLFEKCITQCLPSLKKHAAHILYIVFFQDISKTSRIHPDDLIKTLRELDLARYRSGEYIINATPQRLRSLMAFRKKPLLSLNPEKLKWP